MDNKQFAKLLESRTLKFGIQVIKMSSILPGTTEGWVIRKQITKSGTSIGANYRDANRARSKADFRSKIRICESEASETLFWIDVILAVGWVSVNDLNQLRMECGEILALFTVIGNNTISNKRK